MEKKTAMNKLHQTQSQIQSQDHLMKVNENHFEYKKDDHDITEYSTINENKPKSKSKPKQNKTNSVSPNLGT
jgi:hypothetical protein